MPSLERLQASDCANPAIDIFTKVNGVLTDVFLLEYVIEEDVTNPGTPIQVFPPSGRATVSQTLCPTGEKISTGHYVALFTPPITEPIGNHVVRWFFKLTATAPEQTFSEEFQVLAVATGSSPPGYCTVAQIRAQGVTVAQKSDLEVIALIELATAYIDKFTGRWFDPRSKVLLLDGTGARKLLLGPPIISISKIRLIGVDTSGAVPEVALDGVRIYNRHLTQGLLDPDDRESPKIEFLVFDERFETFPTNTVPSAFDLTRWPEGTQNVEVTGIFGYTDDDGSAVGRTPLLIERACAMLVIRNLPLLTDADGLQDAQNASRVLEYKTRDQTIKYADPSKLGSRGVGAFTGDPAIDTILAGYVRPPHLGAA